jgi:hypothetical protein
MNKMATVVGFFEDSKAAKIQFDGEEKPAEKEYPYLSSYSPKLDDRVFCMEFGDSFIIMGEVNFQTEPFSLDNTFTENLKPIKNDLKATKDDLTTAKSKHDTDIQGLTKKLTDTKTELSNSISQTNNSVSNLSSSLNSVKGDLSTAKNDISNVKKTADEASTKSVNNSHDISTNQYKISSNADAIKKVDSRVDDVLKKDTFDTLKVTRYVGFFGASATSKRNVYTVSNTSDVSSVGSKLNELINALRNYGLV